MGNDQGQPKDAESGEDDAAERTIEGVAEASDASDDRASLSPRVDRSPLPFENLKAPEPIPAAPPTGARILAFGSILIAGLLGGLIGYGTGDLMADSAVWAGVGALVGASAGAIGVGVVANLTMRAMNEWRAVDHPESETRASSGLVVRKTKTEAAVDDVEQDRGR